MIFGSCRLFVTDSRGRLSLQIIGKVVRRRDGWFVPFVRNGGSKPPPYNVYGRVRIYEKPRPMGEVAA